MLSVGLMATTLFCGAEADAESLDGPDVIATVAGDGFCSGAGFSGAGVFFAELAALTCSGLGFSGAEEFLLAALFPE